MYCQGSKFKPNDFKPQIAHRTVFPAILWFIMFLFDNSLDKALSLLLIFVCVVEGHAHFQLEILRYSQGPKRPVKTILNR